MESKKYPEWALADLIEFVTNSRRRGFRFVVIEKLITDDRMINVWESIGRNNICEVDFALQVFRARISSISKEYMLIESERNSLISEAQDLIRRLIDISDKIGLDNIDVFDLLDDEDLNDYSRTLDKVTGNHHNSVIGGDKYVRDCFKSIFAGFFRADGIIRNLPAALDDEKNKSVIIQKKDESAIKRIFIRKLSHSLYHKYGKPMRMVVAETTGTLFDCDVTEKDVARIAPESFLKSNII